MEIFSVQALSCGSGQWVLLLGLPQCPWESPFISLCLFPSAAERKACLNFSCSVYKTLYHLHRWGSLGSLKKPLNVDGTKYSKAFVWYEEIIIMVIAFHTEMELRFSTSSFCLCLTLWLCMTCPHSHKAVLARVDKLKSICRSKLWKYANKRWALEISVTELHIYLPTQD